MADSYTGSSVASRAIYPTRFIPYLALMVTIKFFQAFSVFLTYDILKLVHIVVILFCLRAGSAVCLIFIQKPFSSKRITKNQWFRIGRHALVGMVLSLLWLFGLTLCGPLRTLLLFEHNDMVVLAGASAMFTHSSTPAKFRGAVFFLLAVMGILLFDHDLNDHPPEHNDMHRHNSVLTHLFDHATNLTGLSDHKGGVVLLFATLCLSVGYKSASKKLSVDVGGAKRLNALSTFASAILLLPWALFVHFTRESPAVVSWGSLVLPLSLVIMVGIADYYVEATCVNRLDQSRTSRFGTMATFVSALVLVFLWNHPFIAHITNMKMMAELVREDHVLSGGVVFSFVLFMFATHILTCPTRGSKGNLVGYSAAGLPLYNFAGDAIQKTSHSVMLVAKNGLRQILEESDSRKIFYFLCLNLSFTFVELVYGVWTNSLGLISDGFHMLFDCSALVMGLYAAVMSRWKATRTFSFGFDRVEILSGFINGLFLMVIAFFVFTAAMARVWDPPEIRTERLLAVSVAGLVVNLLGIAAFHHGHGHGGHGHSHGGHGHSHSHGHSHGKTPASGADGAQMTQNTNMEGVFLHVLADTLGSVGVIVSTLLIEAFGWQVADPICSIFIATLIFASVVPLVKATCLILLLRTPVDFQALLGTTLQKLLSMEGVLSYRDEHFWRHSAKVICGTIHIQTRPDASEAKILSQVTTLFKDVGVINLTVQVEKEAYFQHMSGLGAPAGHTARMTQTFKALNQEYTEDFIKAI